MAALSFTAKNISVNPSQGSIVRSYKAASSISSPLGKAVALDSNGDIILADANASQSAATAIGVIVALSNVYAENATLAAGESCAVCVFGPVWGFSGLAEGGYGWVGTTAGEIVDTAPSTAYQYTLGQNLTSACFFVRPGIASPSSAA